MHVQNNSRTQDHAVNHNKSNFYSIWFVSDKFFSEKCTWCCFLLEANFVYLRKVQMFTHQSNTVLSEDHLVKKTQCSTMSIDKTIQNWLVIV